MLAIVDFPYSTNEKLSELSRTDYLLLRERIPTMKLEDWPADGGRPYWYRYSEPTVIDLSTDAALLSQFGISYSVERIKNSYVVAHEQPNGTTINLNFALPNIGLLSITEVTWLDNACTEDLQRRLGEGWRIIAVCPPNGARRPDYILGRTAP